MKFIIDDLVEFNKIKFIESYFALLIKNLKFLYLEMLYIFKYFTFFVIFVNL